jgi:hypothetical protein
LSFFAPAIYRLSFFHRGSNGASVAIIPNNTNKDNQWNKIDLLKSKGTSAEWIISTWKVLKSCIKITFSTRYQFTVRPSLTFDVFDFSRVAYLVLFFFLFRFIFLATAKKPSNNCLIVKSCKVAYDSIGWYWFYFLFF